MIRAETLRGYAIHWVVLLTEGESPGHLAGELEDHPILEGPWGDTLAQAVEAYQVETGDLVLWAWQDCNAVYLVTGFSR